MTEGFLGGLAVAGAGYAYLRRRSPYFRSLPVTIKTLGVVLVVAPAIAAQAERRGLQYDMEHNWSVSFSLSLPSFKLTNYMCLGQVLEKLKWTVKKPKHSDTGTR